MTSAPRSVMSGTSTTIGKCSRLLSVLARSVPRNLPAATVIVMRHAADPPLIPCQPAGPCRVERVSDAAEVHAVVRLIGLVAYDECGDVVAMLQVTGQRGLRDVDDAAGRPRPMAHGDLTFGYLNRRYPVFVYSGRRVTGARG